MISRRTLFQALGGALAALGVKTTAGVSPSPAVGSAPEGPGVAANAPGSDSWLVEHLRGLVKRGAIEWRTAQVWTGDHANILDALREIRLHPLLFRRLGWEMRQFGGVGTVIRSDGRPIEFLGARVVETAPVPIGSMWVGQIPEAIDRGWLEVLPAPELVWEGEADRA